MCVCVCVCVYVESVNVFGKLGLFYVCDATLTSISMFCLFHSFVPTHTHSYKQTNKQLIAQDSKLAAGQTVARYATNSWDVVRWTVQTHGVARLWRGASLTMWRDGIGVAAFFAAKRWTEEILTTRTTTAPTFGTSVLAGGLAGLAFWIVSLPLDTMKTWIQSADLHQPPVHVGTELRRLWQQSNANPWRVAQRLLRGWQVAYGRGIPSAAITISVYSTAYHALERQQQGVVLGRVPRTE